MQVLIIDDEPNVRTGLKVLIPWEEYGFKVMDEGIDGVDGLNKILSLQPELVLIDIRMPGLNGLEVIEKARAQGYKGKFIITTGYSDFEYAKKAISLGVSTYILKPIDEEELIEAVKSIHEQINEETDRKTRLEISNDYIQKGLMTNLILGKTLTECERKQYDLIEQEKVKYCIAIVDASNQDKKDETIIIDTLRQALLNIKANGHVLALHEQIVLVLDNHINMKKWLERVQRQIEQNQGYGLKIALSSPKESLESIHQGYLQAKRLLEEAFLFPELKLLAEPIMQEEREVDSEYGDAKWLGKQLFALIQVGDDLRLEEELCKLKMLFRVQHTNRQKIASICSNTFLNIIQFVVDTYSEVKECVPSGETVIEQIYQCKDIDNVICYIKQELLKILESLKAHTPESTMDKIIYYIDNNYSSELKLEHLATLFNYNSAYLGKSFKNHTGKSFNVYLDQVRINRAKELLLQGDLKVYEIAQVVGYKHMDYFHSKFKKYVGLSPLEYKKGGQI